MGDVTEGRHLAAIMFVDMVGYSARMHDNEPRAIAAVRGLWELVRPVLAEHHGREVDLAGDGMLMEFPGALAAVQCSLKIHRLLHDRNGTLPEADRIRTRAGVHLGDIEHRDGRIYGDGVNIAARVIALAPPGGVAMTGHVRDQLTNILAEVPERLGTKTLKNIKTPQDIWCLPGPDCTRAEVAAARAIAQDEVAARRWTFETAVFDERTLELTVDGQPVELEPKALEMLTFLLHHAGEVVTKDELLEAIWPGRVLSETVLTKCISRLREALRDDDQSKIKTVHGFGYRVTVPVKVEVAAAESVPHFDFKAGDHLPLRPLWSLVRHLGQGGHGDVWLVRHDKTREERVFKFALDPAHLASLKREITLSRLLNDSFGGRKCFVRVLDWNLEQLPYFIECEYSKAGSLVEWAGSQGGLDRVPLAARIDLAAQLAEAVAAAHSVGVLHKDLKPGNVLVDDADVALRIRLTDFGSGGVLDTQRLENLGITRMGFTRTVLDAGSTSGTPIYLAPEILAGQPFTVQSDIYALGVVLFQLVVGDLQKFLAPGWELKIEDELLREDIAETAHGDPARRLADASILAQRLRALPERRAQRETDNVARLKSARREQELARYRVRRWWTAGIAAAFAAFAIGAFFLWVHTFGTLEWTLEELHEAAVEHESHGRYAEAEKHFNQILQIRQFAEFPATVASHIVVFEYYGSMPLSLLNARDDLARVLMEQRRFGEALFQYRVIDGAYHTEGESATEPSTDNPDHARFMSNYGECLRRHGKLQRARELLEFAQETLGRTLTPEDPRLRTNTERLRAVYGALGLKDEGARLPPPATP